MCRSVECTGNNPKSQRVPDRSRLRDVVRPGEHEGFDDGRDERCDRGSRRDAIRREPAVQGVCQLSHGGCECLALLQTLVLKSGCIGIVSDSSAGHAIELRPSAGAGHDPTDDAE